MDPTLLAILVKNVVLPEVLVAIRAHQNATGQMPTDEQVIAALNTDADRYISIGQAFLAQTAAK